MLHTHLLPKDVYKIAKPQTVAKWFTYKKHDGSVCELFESCEYFSNDECDNCVSGQVSCSESECNRQGVNGSLMIRSQVLNDIEDNKWPSIALIEP